MKFKDFKAPVLFSSTFKALNLGEKNSSTFKDFYRCVGTLGVDDRGSNGAGSWQIKLRLDTAKLTNLIVTGFGETYNLVSKSKMFVKDK